MPGWLLAALRLIAIGLGGGAAFGAGQELVQRGGAPPGGGGFPGERFAGDIRTFIEGDVVRPKRRRRRRALTASDRADIAFIVGLLGPTAGKNFAVTLAGRSR